VHVRPNEDAEVIRRFVHVPVPAGAAVFWDQRLPHANARWNKGKEPRSVVYGGFLPRGKGIFINQAYAKEQLRRLKEGRAQPDFWLHEKERSAPWGLGGEEGAASALFASLSVGAVNMLK
jgi:ectoine hydroxylase-related dioxygenase (phytanoyl-CoA dioxygenase family)